jgi:hypothetical protein
MQASSKEKPLFDYLLPAGTPSHALQMVIDTLAYGQNIPLRMLDFEALGELPKKLSKLASQENAQKLIRDELGKKKIATATINETLETFALLKPKQFDDFAKKVVGLAHMPTNPELLIEAKHPSDIDGEAGLYALLVLLPHVEREIWWTEMGNPLPGHLISRMVEHWSLYVLCWCYLNLKLPVEAVENEKFHRLSEHDEVLGVGNYWLSVSPPFEKINNPKVRLIAGPVWIIDKNESDDQKTRHSQLFNRFTSFINQASKQSSLPWHDAKDHSPEEKDLQHALEARMDFMRDEALMRAQTSYEALNSGLFGASVNLSGETFITRAHWETMAALSCWFFRHKKTISSLTQTQPIHNLQTKSLNKTRNPVLSWLSGHKKTTSHLAQPIYKAPLENLEGDYQEIWEIGISHHAYFLKVIPCKELAATNYDFAFALEKSPSNRLHSTFPKALNADKRLTQLGMHLDMPDVFFNRLRERQQASFTAQIIAINNLLNCHAKRKLGLDEHETLGANNVLLNAKRMGTRVDEAEHLMRGYSGRLCHHLIGITRADVADLYWVDYAQTPPRLVHAGGYAKHLAHRANRQSIHEAFDSWAYSTNYDECPASMRQNSESQAYRVAFTRKECTVGKAYFEPYELFEKLQCGIGVPLLVNGRAVGVLTLAGKQEGQFDERLFPALQRATNLIAQTMYQASLLWQMRQMSWLTTHLPYALWKEHGEKNQFNPLRVVSQCLCNIFLCRAAHLWLVNEAQESRYELHGYNQSKIFQSLKEAPSFEWSKPSSEKKGAVHDEDLTRAFACFALDAVELAKKTSASSNDEIPAADPLLGDFQVAVYSAESNQKTAYNLVNAKKGLRLFKDFLETEQGIELQATHTQYRHKIFEQEQLNHMLACVLLKDNSQQTQAPRYVPLGLLTLHDVDGSTTSTSTTLDAHEWPWSMAWRPVVAHVQTWLPNLLMQMEIYHTPMESMRRFLIHSVRGEMIAIRAALKDIYSYTQNLGPDDEWSRNLRKGARKNQELISLLLTSNLASSGFSSKAIQEMKDLVLHEGQLFQSALDQSNTTRNEVKNLLSPKRINELNKLVAGIENMRTLSSLGLDANEANQRFNLREQLQGILTRHQQSFDDGRFRIARLDKQQGFENDVFLRLPLLWWNQLSTTLIENASKYAQESFEISWQAASKTLVFENVASYNPELDKPARLTAMYARGSAAEVRDKDGNTPPGLGLGLWGVKCICEFLNIGFAFDIIPQSATLARDRPLARYRISLNMPSSVVFKTLERAT